MSADIVLSDETLQAMETGAQHAKFLRSLLIAVIQEHHGGVVRIRNESIGAAYFADLTWEGSGINPNGGAVIKASPR